MISNLVLQQLELVSLHTVYLLDRRLVGAGQTVYNGSFIVQENVGLTTFMLILEYQLYLHRLYLVQYLDSQRIYIC